MRKIWMAYALCIAFFTSNSQILVPAGPAPYLKINTYSSANRDAFSAMANQASLAGVQTVSAGFYGERRFMLKDLSSYALAFAQPTHSGNFGVVASYFGNAGLNQSALGLAYGRTLGKIDVGAQFNYDQFKIEGYGTASAVTVEVGLMLHLTDQFQAGVHLYNPTGATVSKTGKEKLPMIYSFGLGYDVSDKVFIGTEIEKTEDQPVNVNAGLQYAFEKKLFARMGVATATSSFYLGVGFAWNVFRVDVTASVHPTLGTTPAMLLLYNSPAQK